MNGRHWKDDWTRYRTGIVGWAGVAVVAEWLTHALPHSLISLSDVEHWFGIGMLCAGLALRSWAAGFLVKREELTTRGPYACLRHPLYLGTLLMMLGFAELLEDRIALVTLVVVFAVTHVPAMLTEERYLATRYGQAWVDYRSQTPAFFPLTPGRCQRSGWDWEKWRRSDEWACWCLSALALAAMQTAAMQ